MHRLNQLLSTKFYIPPFRPEFISRPRLLQQLNDGLHRKMTLISAPAGFGKTTLVSEWVEHLRRSDLAEKPQIAWLSLDESDSQLAQFLMYCIHALKQVPEVDPGLGEDALAMIRAAQQLAIEPVLTSLINEIAGTGMNILFILDDYHVIESPEVDEALTFMLDNLPPNLHLLITSRIDPSLPLPRLRARLQITEMRAADLRFTHAEAVDFFAQVFGLQLTADQIAALESRTEGWITGLQLAALSMQGRDDIPGFIRTFTGDHRYIIDYLVDEVLQRQTGETRQFLLQTSILGQLNGSLCNAVTGRSDSLARLRALGRANLFIVPLDDRWQWYRYHHLFGDVLRAHLKQEQDGQEQGLHLRASEWYEQNGMFAEAIHHARAAEAFSKVAELVELAWPAMDHSRQIATWLKWVRTLPDELIRSRPVVSAGYAWALLDRGELEAGAARLRDAEDRLQDTSDGYVFVDTEEFRFLPATIASARTYHALAVGDIPGAASYAHQALEILPADEYLRRGTPAALLALASWTTGELETADLSLSEAMRSYQKAGNILYAVTGAYALADIRIFLGRLRQAFDVCQQALTLAQGQADFVRFGMADVYSALSDLYRETNDLEAAEAQIRSGESLGEQSQVPRWRYRWHLARARLKESRGALAEALEELEAAERTYRRGPMPDVRPVAAMRARIWIRQNRLSEASIWAAEQNLSAGDELSFLREYEHITLARLMIAQLSDGSAADPIPLLTRLASAAQAGGRQGSAIEISLLLAVAYHLTGDADRSLDALEYALRLAEPEGYVRLFVDEGEPVASLLADANRLGILPGYTAKLLAAFDQDSTIPADLPPHIEPLSERELEILQMVAEGLSNRQIAERLFLALSTVKGYNQSIFGKLQVRRRTEAVARARALGLV